jgi:hypothetical protein
MNWKREWGLSSHQLRLLQTDCIRRVQRRWKHSTSTELYECRQLRQKYLYWPHGELWQLAIEGAHSCSETCYSLCTVAVWQQSSNCTFLSSCENSRWITVNESLLTLLTTLYTDKSCLSQTSASGLQISHSCPQFPFSKSGLCAKMPLLGGNQWTAAKNFQIQYYMGNSSTDWTAVQLLACHKVCTTCSQSVTMSTGLPLVCHYSNTAFFRPHDSFRPAPKITEVEYYDSDMH